MRTDRECVPRPDLVTASLARIPGAEERQARGGFGSRVAGVGLGAWRFTPATGTRLLVAHVVGGTATSEEPLLTIAAAQRVAGAIEEHLASFGPQILPDVLAVLEGLAVASGRAASRAPDRGAVVRANPGRTGLVRSSRPGSPTRPPRRGRTADGSPAVAHR